MIDGGMVSARDVIRFLSYVGDDEFFFIRKMGFTDTGHALLVIESQNVFEAEDGEWELFVSDDSRWDAFDAMLAEEDADILSDIEEFMGGGVNYYDERQKKK